MNPALISFLWSPECYMIFSAALISFLCPGWCLCFLPPILCSLLDILYFLLYLLSVLSMICSWCRLANLILKYFSCPFCFKTEIYLCSYLKRCVHYFVMQITQELVTLQWTKIVYTKNIWNGAKPNAICERLSFEIISEMYFECPYIVLTMICKLKPMNVTDLFKHFPWESQGLIWSTCFVVFQWKQGSGPKKKPNPTKKQNKSLSWL